MIAEPPIIPRNINSVGRQALQNNRMASARYSSASSTAAKEKDHRSNITEDFFEVYNSYVWFFFNYASLQFYALE